MGQLLWFIFCSLLFSLLLTVLESLLSLFFLINGQKRSISIFENSFKFVFVVIEPPAKNFTQLLLRGNLQMLANIFRSWRGWDKKSTWKRKKLDGPTTIQLFVTLQTSKQCLYQCLHSSNKKNTDSSAAQLSSPTVLDSFASDCNDLFLACRDLALFHTNSKNLVARCTDMTAIFQKIGAKIASHEAVLETLLLPMSQWLNEINSLLDAILDSSTIWNPNSLILAMDRVLLQLESMLRSQ